MLNVFFVFFFNCRWFYHCWPYWKYVSENVSVSFSIVVWFITEVVNSYFYYISIIFYFFQVSWLRRQEGQLRLLSVGLDIYAGDSRYTAALLHPNDWTLAVRGAEEADEGWYECQVSSHPPLVHTLYLRVVGRGWPAVDAWMMFGTTNKILKDTPFSMILLHEWHTLMYNSNLFPI